MRLRSERQNCRRLFARTFLAILLVLGCTALDQTPLALAATQDLGLEFEVEGTVNDLSHRTSSSGHQFQVQFRDIAYAGNVDRTLVKQTDAEHLTVWMSLKDLKLTIRSTAISGRRHSALCGPLQIALGTRRELWVALDLEKKTQGSQVRLVHVKTRCDLSGDNWQVGSPAWVRPTGFGMTESKVVSGLRSGLQGQDECIEQQVTSVGPVLYAKIEPKIRDLLIAGQLTSR